MKTDFRFLLSLAIREQWIHVSKVLSHNRFRPHLKKNTFLCWKTVEHFFPQMSSVSYISYIYHIYHSVSSVSPVDTDETKKHVCKKHRTIKWVEDEVY